MAAGQAALSVAADAAALDALAAELALAELTRGALHVAQLRALLRMHAVGTAAGTDLATVPHAALALGSSEARGHRLLAEALLLGALPGALEAVECGLLTVEQSAAVAQQLAPLPLPARLQVWVRLQQRLLDTCALGAVLPPARLTSLLRRWAVEADPADATQRRRRAQEERALDVRRRGDGLHDLFAFGFTGPDLQAALSRIRDRAHPVGPADERTAEQRRFDAFKDILLGRDPLPLDDPHDPTAPCPCAAPAGGGRARCGCLPGAPAPCGAQVLVHVTIGAALGTSDQPAELVGHGPLEPDLLQELLLAAPRVRPVWTDDDGVVRAVGDAVLVPRRGDPVSVREALLHLAGLPPPPLLHPRHPQDHPPGSDPPPQEHGSSRAHPADRAGSYRVPRRLRRLIDVRSPRCEWPGCGVRAVRCDAEHDLAWPQGPTCACNLGPCCRRHHRVKQLGWTKTRGAGSAVAWTSPGGAGRWLSSSQQEAALQPVRPLPPLRVDDPLAEVSPLQQDEELWWLAGCPDDPEGLELRAVEPVQDEVGDVLGELIRSGSTRWALDLDDPYAWLDLPAGGDVRTACRPAPPSSRRSA